MQFRAAATCTAVMAIAACASTAVKDRYKDQVDYRLAISATPTREVAAPGELAPHPWKIGQWATYGIHGPADATTAITGYETISLVAEDTCGFWFVDEYRTYDHAQRSMICLRAPEPGSAPARPADLVQRVIVECDGGPPTDLDLSDARNPRVRAFLASPTVGTYIAGLLPAVWSGDGAPREDVAVPAGRFAMTVRTIEKVGTTERTRWAHPAVPFAGTVAQRTVTGERKALIAYGDTGAASVLPELATQLAAARGSGLAGAFQFLELGAGSSWLTGGHGEDASAADDLVLRSGLRVTPSVDAVADFTYLGVHHYSPDPTMTETASAVLVGARWHPVAPLPASPGLTGAAGLYLTATAGYARIERGLGTDRDLAASGLGIHAALGWIPLRMRSIDFGFEAGDHVMVLDHDEPTRHNFAAMSFFDVNLPSW